MSLTFVNHNGDPISATRMAAMRAQGAELERKRNKGQSREAHHGRNGTTQQAHAPEFAQ